MIIDGKRGEISIMDNVFAQAPDFMINSAPVFGAAPNIEISSEIHWLNVPYNEKDEAKKLGAKWNMSAKKWYYEGKTNPAFSRWEAKQSGVTLSDEQSRFIDIAATGRNILVDACIGSGKTMSIQALCNKFSDKRILYLTYNRLLKVDAQSKIITPNTVVTNYHGYASMMLSAINVSKSPAELIQGFLDYKDMIQIPGYDILVIDEYQDIDLEISKMLDCIKRTNKDMQIIAVGDMEQKIYDKTSLDVKAFIDKFLGAYDRLTFTKCFRISPNLANRLGQIWNKEINGCNNNCVVESMDVKDIVPLLSKMEPSQILCLGARSGSMTKVLNTLERSYGDKFNKNTVYASISDEERDNLHLGADSAIFTTYDSSKGLERPVCVVFDCTESYWESRINKPNTRYEILRNIFCVAMSRGKDRIIFALDGDNNEEALSNETIMSHAAEIKSYMRPFEVSSMFNFKFKEDVEACYDMLNIKQLKIKDTSEIKIKGNDGLIDLSPCIGVMQEAKFFTNYNIEQQIDFAASHHTGNVLIQRPDRSVPFYRKVLYLTALDTGQERYYRQIRKEFIKPEALDKVFKRLNTILSPDETVQEPASLCVIAGGQSVNIDARCDVLRDDCIYELKFVSELEHNAFLQCAMYTIMYGKPCGYLWNTRHNQLYKITVPDKAGFLCAVIKAITKGTICPQRLSSFQTPGAALGVTPFIKVIVSENEKR